jgi:hypothetical protein
VSSLQLQYYCIQLDISIEITMEQRYKEVNLKTVDIRDEISHLSDEIR